MTIKIPATIITGFLGAGKTTLIRHMLENARGRRIALVINEFGDLGVDGDILKGCEDETCHPDDIMELSNGCICCTVADDFIPTLNILLNRELPPDHIVIETSGLALPQPLVRAFNWPEIKTKVTVDGVVTVVDAAALHAGQFAASHEALEAMRQADDNLDHETPLHELFEDQIACADMIIVNKTDLLETSASNAIVQSLKDQSRAGVQVIKTSRGVVPPDALLGQAIGAEADMAAREAHHHHHHDHDHEDGHHHAAEDHGHDEFKSFVLNLGEVADAASFTERVKKIIEDHHILRLKGFVAVKGKPMRMTLQAVGPRIETYYEKTPFAAKRETRLVVIGLAKLDEAAISAAFQK